MKTCKLCDSPIENSHFKLCKKHNLERLSEKKKDEHKPLKLNTKKRVDKTQAKIDLDELFYEECFNSCTNHSCEECGVQLPDVFRDASHKVVARSRYSHILPKSTFPRLRHNIMNINHLCQEHHFQWEFGDRKSMKIYQENKKRFPDYLK